MDVVAQVEARKRTALAEVQELARSGDAAGVARRARELERLAEMQQTLQRLAAELAGLERGVSDPSETPVAGATGRRDVAGGRERGRQARVEFLRWLKDQGIVLQRERGNAIFATASRKGVGISYANEGHRRGRWFMGLPVSGYMSAVLLCQSESTVHRLVLSTAFLARHGTALSSSNGQFKINVVQRAPGEFFVSVPGAGLVRVAELSSVEWLV